MKLDDGYRLVLLPSGCWCCLPEKLERTQVLEEKATPETSAPEGIPPPQVPSTCRDCIGRSFCLCGFFLVCNRGNQAAISQNSFLESTLHFSILFFMIADPTEKSRHAKETIISCSQVTVAICLLMHAMVIISLWSQAAGIPPVSDLSKLEAMLKGSTDSDEIVRLRAFTAEFGCYLSEDRSVFDIFA